MQFCTRRCKLRRMTHSRHHQIYARADLQSFLFHNINSRCVGLALRDARARSDDVKAFLGRSRGFHPQTALQATALLTEEDSPCVMVHICDATPGHVSMPNIFSVPQHGMPVRPRMSSRPGSIGNGSLLTSEYPAATAGFTAAFSRVTRSRRRTRELSTAPILKF
jgi:hypothetical protein